MNYSTAIFLINKHARAVLAVYENDYDNPSAKKTLFKTLDQSVSEGDFVIVETDTRHGMTVVKVVEADVDVDFDSSAPVRWVVGKVDRAAHDQLRQQEEAAIKAIKSAELRKKREDLREAMFADHVETIKALPIAAMNGDEPEPASSDEDG